MVVFDYLKIVVQRGGGPSQKAFIQSDLPLVLSNDECDEMSW